MKKVLFLIIACVVAAFAYCKHMSKSGEYYSDQTFQNGSIYDTRVCVYGGGVAHIPVVFFNQHYCPAYIEYDTERNRVCDW